MKLVGRRNWRLNWRCQVPKDRLWLVAWCLVGLGLRFLSLTTKSIWSDEWATLVFSLGHGFQPIPLDQIISLDTLLAPAQVGPMGSEAAGAPQVVQRLMDESTHPPLYFLLCHAWLQLWQSAGEPVSVGWARSLSALLGTLSIPLAYGLGLWITAPVHNPQEQERTRWVARAAAALMAVSPFGIYLAQEARHYTLAILLGMVSLGCFLRAWCALDAPSQASQASHESPQESQPFLARPLPLLRLPTIGLGSIGLWVGANLLGIATHYFVGLLLLAQATALLLKILILIRFPPTGTNPVRRAVGVNLAKGERRFVPTHTIQSILVAMGLTLLGALPWGIFLIQIPGDRLTSWVQKDFSPLELLLPPLRLLAGLGSMVLMPPIEGLPIRLVILATLPLLAALIWLIPQLFQAWTHPTHSPFSILHSPFPPPLLSGLLALLLSFLGWMLLSTYGFGRDLTLGSRYLFGLLPVMVLMLAIAVAQARYSQQLLTLLIFLGLLGSLSITQGYAYGKPDRSDLLYQQIQASYQQRYPNTASYLNPTDVVPSGPPLIIGGVYKTHEQLSEMMSLAYEWQRRFSALPEPQFFITQRDPQTKFVPPQLQMELAQLPHPYELWLLNFAANIDFAGAGCQVEPAERLKVPGYWARRYVCPAISAENP